MQPMHPTQSTHPMQPTQPRQRRHPTVATQRAIAWPPIVRRLASTPTLPAVAALASTPMLPAVAALAATPMLPAVAALASTPMLPAVAALPATPMLPPVAVLPTTARLVLPSAHGASGRSWRRRRSLNRPMRRVCHLRGSAPLGHRSPSLSGMLHHIVLITKKDSASDEAVDAAVEALAGLPAEIPAIRSYEVVREAGLSERNADLAVVASFDSVEDYQTYLAHPAHAAVGAEHLVPLAEGFAAIQYLSDD